MSEAYGELLARIIHSKAWIKVETRPGFDTLPVKGESIELGLCPHGKELDQYRGLSGVWTVEDARWAETGDGMKAIEIDISQTKNIMGGDQ